MDSINQNQEEENRKDLNTGEALKKMKELIDKAESCFFCTGASGGLSNGARPMSVQQVDEEGNLWFLSANDSHKNQEISTNPAVNLYFQGSAHSQFLHIAGTATITEDKTKIKELWQPILKTWFTKGVDDPRISAIKVEPNDGYYWDNKHGNMVAGVKMLIGAAIGKTMDDSIEGKINV